LPPSLPAVKRTLHWLLLAGTVGASGCTTSPAAKAPKEPELYVLVEETGSRIKRRVPISELHNGPGSGSSPVKTLNGDGLRSKSSLGEALGTP